MALFLLPTFLTNGVPMKRTQLYAPTLREAPNEAETTSHQWLVRSGYVRQLASGVYSYLPLGLRVKRNIEHIIREELNRIGGLEFELPSLQPADLWKATGRWNAIGTEMLRLRDRAGRELCLGMTHEEIFASLAKELRSYKELPAIWYQIAKKFRDEPRPRGGLIRLREFTMKDSYSFALTQEALRQQFLAHEQAYRQIFTRCGLEFVVAEADNGNMGGSRSSEFVAMLEAGEDFVAVSENGYAANLEVAVSILEPLDDHNLPLEVQEFATPNVHTIEDLTRFSSQLFPDGVPATSQIKTLVMVAQGETIVVLLRGDHQLNLTKLGKVLGSDDLRPANSEETFAAMGAHFGSLGPIGTQARIIADSALQGRRGLVSGANKDGYHLAGLESGRDFNARFADVRTVKDGELALDGTRLSIRRGLEMGHIFELGTRYAAALGALVQDAAGQRQPLVMGSYGIGVDRLLAAIAETHSDQNGLCFPHSVSPFAVALLELGDTGGVAEQIYTQLQAAGLEVLFDDRPDARAGEKFTEWEMQGIPQAVVVGKKSLERGVVEIRNRLGGKKLELGLDSLMAYLKGSAAT
jgi:prolyl-tRNA synthetase